MKYIKLFEDYLDKLFRIAKNYGYKEIGKDEVNKTFLTLANKEGKKDKIEIWNEKEARLINDVLNKLRNRKIQFPSEEELEKKIKMTNGELRLYTFTIGYETTNGVKKLNKKFEFGLNRIEGYDFLFSIKTIILDQKYTEYEYYICDEIEGLVHFLTDHIAWIIRDFEENTISPDVYLKQAIIDKSKQVSDSIPVRQLNCENFCFYVMGANFKLWTQLNKKSKLKVGDIIVFGYDIPQHYAIYLGNGEVIEVEEWGKAPKKGTLKADLDYYEGILKIYRDMEINNYFL